ncbi:hypothetical protein D3C73_1132520 [compost metagenome]
MLPKIGLGQRQAGLGGHWTGGDFRLHPVVGLVLEISEGAGQENRKQQPAENQAGPGVQPGHGLAKALFHDRSIQYPIPAAAAKTRPVTINPNQARHAERQAKHQITASR